MSQAGSRCGVAWRALPLPATAAGLTDPLFCCPLPAAPAAQVLDDFVRNFLREAGLSRTLEQFETEWYEVRARAHAHTHTRTHARLGCAPL